MPGYVCTDRRQRLHYFLRPPLPGNKSQSTLSPSFSSSGEDRVDFLFLFLFSSMNTNTSDPLLSFWETVVTRETNLLPLCTEHSHVTEKTASVTVTKITKNHATNWTNIGCEDERAVWIKRCFIWKLKRWIGIIFMWGRKFKAKRITNAKSLTWPCAVLQVANEMQPAGPKRPWSSYRIIRHHAPITPAWLWLKLYALALPCTILEFWAPWFLAARARFHHL